MVGPTRSQTVEDERRQHVDEMLDSKLNERLDQLNARFNEFESFLKGDLIQSLKTEIKNDIKKELTVVIESAINDQNQKIINLESSVAILQSQVTFLKNKMNEGGNKHDDLEQYGRRVCRRFGGIDKPEVNDGANNFDCLGTVKKLWEDAGVSVPDPCIDRAHWVGNTYIDNKTGKNVQDIIVRLTTFRHRTMIYRARSKIKARVALDLTKLRYDILKRARVVADASNIIDYVFVGINCRFKAKMMNGSFQYFNNLEELEALDSQ